MTKTDIINATLLSAGVALIGEGLAVIHTTVWVGLALVIVGVGVFAVREVLP